MTSNTSCARASPSRGAGCELRFGGSQAHGTTGRDRTYVVQHGAAPGLNQHDSYYRGASLRLAVLWLGASCSLDTPVGATTLSAFRARTAGRRYRAFTGRLAPHVTVGDSDERASAVNTMASDLLPTSSFVCLRPTTFRHAGSRPQSQHHGHTVMPRDG